MSGLPDRFSAVPVGVSREVRMNTSLCLQMQMRPSPQLVVISKFLGAGRAELEGMILRELDANPVLENLNTTNQGFSPGLPETSLRSPRLARARKSSGWHADRERSTDLLANCPAHESILVQLACQIRLLASGSHCDLALALLAHLDDRGYLSADPDRLAARLAVAPDQLYQALAVLHELEPPGIGARDGRDCLLIQCDHLTQEGYDCRLPRRILQSAWDDFIRQRWPQVARRAGCTREQVEEAVRFLRNNCYLYPLSMLDQPDDHLAPLADPDIIVRCCNGCYRLEIPGETDYYLQLGAEFSSVPAGTRQGYPHLTTEECAWVQKYVDRAQLIAQALKRRWETLRRVTRYLLEQQTAFFEGDLRHLKPLTRAQVAQALTLSESTVSRAVMNKVVQLPDSRLVLLSDLFDHSLPIKACIKHILEEEDRLLSDHEISERLRDFGHNIARRTVAKYRAQLNLPGKYQRR